ncbi:MAG: AbrB/MazE/SpoVT family DNA-binding domain-containing protein [Ruminococcus sp.]|nr:AbrB/MazE/SpoVT family DNA-binding domain-containing protein [Ruminococcus sp.]
MEFPEGKYAWMVKIGEKGQFVIPKEARELFDIKPGDTVLVLADKERGIAIPPKDMRDKFFAHIFKEMDDLEGGK